jgi:hypothetical protein
MNISMHKDKDEVYSHTPLLASEAGCQIFPSQGGSTKRNTGGGKWVVTVGRRRAMGMKNLASLK